MTLLTNFEILDTINSPKDLKKLSIDNLKILAQEIRDVIIKKVNVTGGHLAPNLGIVETTLAMHYVFNSPIDKFVFDVSHQCYPHKIITGRKDGFIEPELYNKYTGYTAPEESEHDFFKVGHTSTSVSLATGLAKARDLKGENENIVALIGDGSLSGGEAFEGLNNAAVLDSNIIIVINDNDMSIAENHGGLYKNLKLLRETEGKAECNFFKSMGFEYHFLKDGNDIEKLITTFSQIKDTKYPTVIHLCTQKGKGLKIAENDRECYHWVLPGAVDRANCTQTKTEDYGSLTADFIRNKVKEDKSIIAISPATPAVSGFTKDFRKELGKNYTDVGIAEEHAIAMASGIAKNGGRPILAVMSSFIQRTYDQLSQDLALNSNPATILIFWGGITGADATHLTTFDIPLISNIPNIVYLAPTNKEEYLAMLKWSTTQKEHPVAIRVPNRPLESIGKDDLTNYSLLNKYELINKGNEIAVIGLGNFFKLGQSVCSKIQEQLGINATLINPKFITGVDKELLENLKTNHKIIITLEDGVLDGGFGEKISRFYAASDIKVLNYGAEKEFSDRLPLNELYQKYHLTPELIIDDIKTLL